jgi:hypothetical protein
MSLVPRSWRTLCFALLSLPIAAAHIACLEGGEADLDPEKSDTHGAGLTPTWSHGIKIFDGFNRVVDAPVRSDCVRPQSGSPAGAPFLAGEVASTFRLDYVDSRQELAEALDFDARAKIAEITDSLGGGASGGSSHALTSSDKHVSLLVHARETYVVHNQERHQLTEEALATLHTDPVEFVRRCGTEYVGGVAYGAELWMVLQIEASDVEEKQAVKSALDASGIVNGAKLNGDLDIALQSALKDASVRLTASADGRGFRPSADLDSVDASAFFATAAATRKELTSSVEGDLCRDRASCSGVGYLANDARDAVPMALLLRPFNTGVENFPGDLAILDRFLEVGRQASEAAAVLEAHARLYDAMVSIHADEVGALLGAKAPYDFSFYDTTGALPETILPLHELRAHAQAWAAEYRPRSGRQVEALADLVRDCWDRASAGDFSACDRRPADTEAGQRILAAFGDYAHARVRRVYYSFAPNLTLGSDARNACGPGWRQPTRAEAGRLWYAMENNPAIQKMEGPVRHDASVAWYDRQGSECASNENPWIARSMGEFETGCDAGEFLPVPDSPLPRRHRFVALCVPTEGVFGLEVFDLPTR